MQSLHVRDAGLALLLRVLAAPGATAALTLDDWDAVVRAARASRLLAALGARLEEAGATVTIPAAVRGHLESEAVIVRHGKQMVRRELRALTAALEPVDVQAILLKGAAYIVQGLRVAEARTPSDVDILVPREQLDRTEARLREAGWEAEKMDPHDERYYREWSHEVPPMRFPEHALELDLHHAILPPISRVRTDPAPLIAAARSAPGSAFRVLSPEDQVVHACVHAFVDSDLADRLRDIVDLDGLLREFAAVPGFWERLPARAITLGLGRALWYGLRYASRYVSTPVPESAWHALAPYAPAGLTVRVMDWLTDHAVTPPLDGAPRGRGVARALASARYYWIRMPLPILVRHAAIKGVRRLFASPASAS